MRKQGTHAWLPTRWVFLWAMGYMADGLWYMKFDVTQWQRDLDEHPLEIKGAWITICCKLWWASKRGELTLNIERWATLLRIDVADVNRIINYLENEKICDTQRHPNGYVTIMSRKMLRDDKDRELSRLRQRKHRSHINVTQGNDDVTHDVTPESKSKSKNKEIPLCQHKEIVQTYNGILGHLLTPVRYELWNGSERYKNLQARWRSGEKYQTLEFWRGLFEYIRDKCPFLIGTTGQTFKADLGWIVKKNNFIKIIEGNYERR